MIDPSILPLIAILVSAAFGAVSLSWDSDRRATRSMAALFGAISLWALVDLLVSMESDAERARRFMTWTHVGPFLVGPSVLWIVAQMLPHSRARLETFVFRSAIACGAIGVGAAFVPGVIEEMVPTWYGWMPRYGPVSIFLIPFALVLPVHAAILAARIPPRTGSIQSDRKRVVGLRVCMALSIGIAMPTEFLLPLLEIPVPRLGALGAAVASAMVWMLVLHETDDLMLTPRGVARKILAELRDGVALVDLEGRILTTNARFAEMAGVRPAALPGRPLAALLDAPLDCLLEGVEDRESSLQGAHGTAFPVSLSSSIARSRGGRSVGIVVAVRDRREIDALRRQLLSSGRLAAIGELAAGIAHEVNNPVAFIRSDLNLLAERACELRRAVSGSTVGRDQLRIFDLMDARMRRAGERLDRVAQVVVDVREFAHVGGAGQGGSDPVAVVEGAMRLARMQRGDDVSLRIRQVAGHDRFDSGQELKQILLVLLRLLAEETEKAGRIEVDLRTDGRELTVGLAASPLRSSSDTLRVRFESVGASGSAAGADLGLASAAELMEQLGGRLTVSEDPASALRIALTLPLTVWSEEDVRG
ncbi:MAG: PAS domain-containing protein [Myxococcota bacterium]